MGCGYPAHGAEFRAAAAARAAADDAAAARAAADAAFAADADAQLIDQGLSAAGLASRPLWPDAVPSWAREAWGRLQQALLSENQDWIVWTDWYRARLEGRPANEAHEVARVMIAEEIWKKGPRAVNAEIARLIKKFSPPKPLENIPSALGFGWTSIGTIVLASSPVNWPVFPLPTSKNDHRNRLETCRTLAGDLVSALNSRTYQVRGEYLNCLNRYSSRLPDGPGDGNVLLADAEARTLRNLFAADAQILAAGFASQLKTFLEQHIGLRPYYPEIEKFYRDVQTGRIETPLPQDAVEGFVQGVKDNTPIIFDPSVSAAIEGSAQPVPTIVQPSLGEMPAADQSQPAPPVDPLKELDPKKARDFTFGGIVNSLWKVFLEGEKLPKAGEGWKHAGDTLQPYVEPILEWLKSFSG